MRIYAFTDLHGNTKALAELKTAIKELKPDLLICTGDLTVFEQELSPILSRINLLKIPVVMLHGNHEHPERMRKACAKFPNITFLHEEIHEKDGWIFIAYGGGGFEDEDRALARFAKSKQLEQIDWKRAIVLTHAPPHNTKLDDVGERRRSSWHVGSKTLTKLIKERQPSLVLCGHIHEAFRKEDRIGKTKIANPGPNGKLFEL